MFNFFRCRKNTNKPVLPDFEKKPIIISKEIDINERTEIDRWIISELNSLVLKVQNNYEDYEPTKVARLIQDFVINKLSNWHIR